MGFKDFENRVRDVKGKLEENHKKAVEQSVTPIPEENGTVCDSRQQA
ncbi:MAG: hypothetical protein K6T66_12445 [Peptococcaceae bacterium]|nr:hypothetical protein [Peptococcaceae bacterium]